MNLDPLQHTTYRGNFGRYLFGGQDAPQASLGALAKFKVDGGCLSAESYFIISRRCVTIHNY